MSRTLPKNVLMIVGLMAFALVAQLFARDVRAAGIGIFPTELKVDNAARGAEYFRSVGFWHSETSDQTFEMKVSGPAAQYVDFVDVETRTEVIDTVTVPAKDGTQSEGRAVVRVRIPDDAANGTYPGTILVATGVKGSESQEGSSTTVAVGAEINVSISITGEQIVSGVLVNAVTRNVEVGSPVRIQSAVQNSGNVQIIPEFHVAISNGPDIIGEGILTAGVVEPGQTANLAPEFNTEGLDVGSYGIEMSVSYGEVEFGSRTLQFEVVPIGTFTRQGVFDVIELAGPAQLGALTRLNVVFRNTGQIDSKAIFVGEVQRDGVLVEALRSVERVVEPGASQSLDVFVDTERTGEYVVTGKINFEGKETSSKTLTFTVTDSSSSEPPADTGDGPTDRVEPSESGAPNNTGQGASESGDTSSTGGTGGNDAPALESPDEVLGDSGESGGSNNGMIVAGLVFFVALSGLGAAGWMVKRRRPLT